MKEHLQDFAEVIEPQRAEHLMDARAAICDLAVATGDPSLQQHLDLIGHADDIIFAAQADEENHRNLKAHGKARGYMRLAASAEQLLLWHLDKLDRHLFPESH